MYVQVIKGHTDNAEALNDRVQLWVDEVRPGAIGFLGETYGIADDGTFIVLARFEDKQAARANSARPEQDAWWHETVALLGQEPDVRESGDVRTLFGGGSDEATFVQVMEGRATDRAKADALETDEMLEQLHQARPDLLGALRVWFDDDTFAEAAYFTSEAAARQGERSEEFDAPQQEYMALFPDMTFLDLRHPQLT